MATDKQTYNEESYKKKLREAKETYATRKEFVSKWKLPQTEVQQNDSDASNGDGNAVKDNDSGDDTTTAGDNNAIIATAKTKIGAKYILGNEGPTTFDCSGLVYWAYKQNGYTFSRGTAASYYQGFDKITKPQVGDLICFNPGGGRVSHVGLYIDSNTMIHTANPRKNLEITSMAAYWGKHITGYRRIPEKYWPKASSKSISKTRAISIETKVVEQTVQIETLSTIIGDPGVYPPSDLEDQSTLLDGNTGVYPYVSLNFLGDSIKQSNVTREVFLNQRVKWARTTKYTNLIPLNSEMFIHTQHYDGFEGNLYSPDAKRLFENLLLKTRKPYFEVISGFRFSNPGQLSPHEAGCAIDLLVKDIEEVREIADCAWLLGVRSIGIGGDFDSNKGFIHLDIAPKGKDFRYDEVPLYGGPGKWVIR